MWGKPADGLKITAGNSTVKGLIIHEFKCPGILLAGGGKNTIQGNIIGADPNWTKESETRVA